MKQTKYSVIFWNSIETTVHAMGFTEAVILAMAEAIRNGRDCRVNYVTDEKGKTIKDVTMPTFNFSI